MQGIIGVFELILNRSQSSRLHWHGFKIFERSKLVLCKNSLRESVKICLDRTKTGLVLPINFYRTRIKKPVIITRIKSSSNLLTFLVCFFVLFRVDFTHLVLSLLAVVPAMF